MVRYTKCVAIPHSPQQKRGAFEGVYYTPFTLYPSCRRTVNAHDEYPHQPAQARYGRAVPPQADAKSLTGGTSGIRAKRFYRAAWQAHSKAREFRAGLFLFWLLFLSGRSERKK